MTIVNIRISTLLTLLFATFFTQLNAAFYINNEKKAASIPFRWINNLIVLEVLVNGTPLNFILDSGVTESLILNLDQKEIDLKQAYSMEFKGLGKGSSVHGFASYGNIVNIGADFIDTAHTFYVILQTDFEFSRYLGMPVHGIIGYHFFENHVVAIDFEKEKIVVYDELSSVPRLKKYKSLPLTLIGHKPYTTLTFASGGKTYTDQMMLVDLGNSDAIWLFEHAVPGFSFSSDVFADHLGKGFNGDISGIRGRLYGISWPGIEFEEVIAAMPDSASIKNLSVPKGRVGSIGLDLLSRFDLVIDYQGAHFYIRSNRFANRPFRINMSGIDLVYEGEQMLKLAVGYIVESAYGPKGEHMGTVVLASENSTNYVTEWRPAYSVYKVRKGSPADIAGVKEGDRIISINGKPAAAFKLDEIYALLAAGEDKRVSLQVSRNEGKDTLRIQLILKDPVAFRR